MRACIIRLRALLERDLLGLGLLLHRALDHGLRLLDLLLGRCQPLLQRLALRRRAPARNRLLQRGLGGRCL
eukprot:2961974-Rhodomonas_salina.2